MRLRSNDDGTWEIQRLRELEFLMLGKLEGAVDTSDLPEAHDRLYQSPLGRVPVDEAEDEMVEDWEGLVHPDLRDQFRSALEVVLADMDGFKGRKRQGEMEYSLVVPKKHADDWVSALNQARLVLHERHDLPDEDGVLDGEGGAEQWMALLQSEVYGTIIEFLVRHVLWLK